MADGMNTGNAAPLMPPFGNTGLPGTGKKGGKDKHGHPDCSSAGMHHADIEKAYGGGSKKQ